VSVLAVPPAFKSADGKPLFPIKNAEIQRIAVSGSEEFKEDDSVKRIQGRASVQGVRLRDPADFPNLIRYIQCEQDEAGLAFAWTIVVTTVWRSLVKAAMRLVKNESDANTLAGATVAMAYETIGTFDVDKEERRKSKNMEEAFTGWLINAAKNDFIDEIRKMRRLESDQRFTRDDESDGEFTSVYEQTSTEDAGGLGLRRDVRPSFGSILQAESADVISDLKRALRRIATELVSGREKVQAFKMYAFYDYKQKQIGAEFPTYTPQGELKPLTERSVNAWIQEVLAALQQKSPEFEHLCREGKALVESAKAHEDVWKTDRMDAVEERKAIRRGERPRADNPTTLSDRDFLLAKGLKHYPGDRVASVVAVFRKPYENGSSGPVYMAATLRADASPYHPISWYWLRDKEFRQWQSDVVRLDELTAAQKHQYREWKEHCMREVGATVHFDGTPLLRENPLRDRRFPNPSFRRLPAALSGLLTKLTR
jgi:DNA-directed RNA polymerase specialized sigma24 family protein